MNKLILSLMLITIIASSTDTTLAKDYVYQFQDGVLLSKHKISFDTNSLDEINNYEVDGWVNGRNDLILNDDATDIYLMKGNQGKWLKGGVKDEPPAQAVLDRWNRKKVMEPVPPLRDGYHEVIKNDNYATEDVGHYPPLQPDLDNIVTPPPAPAPPKYNAEQWYKLPYKDRESIWSSLSEDERMEMLDSGLKLKPRPIVKQLKEAIQKQTKELTVPTPGLTTHATVVRVIDGDTVVVKVETTLHVRLLDCWMPELKTADGVKAKEVLTNYLGNKDVILEIPASKRGDLTDITTLSRFLGRIWLDGVNVSDYMNTWLKENDK